MSKKQRMILLSVLLCLTGVTLVLIGAPEACFQEKILNGICKYHAFADAGNDFRYIYFINFISVPCRSLIYYELIRDKEVVFYMAPDYSRHDLDNFRLSLDIAPHHMIMHIPQELKEAVQPCLSNPQENLLMQLHNTKEIDAVWRF